LQENPDGSIRLVPDKKAINVPLEQFHMGNGHGFDPRSGNWLISTITNLLGMPTSPPAHPVFSFELSQEEAAKANFKILQENNMSLHKILTENTFSALSYGSEFKPVAVLEPLFQFHPGWPVMNTCLENGSSYPVTEKDEQSRIADLEGFLQRGNHKLAKGARAPLLYNKMVKEVARGWSIPLLPEHALEIPKAEGAPHGLPCQDTINEKGEITPKDRPTHDLSFPGCLSKTSINSRIDEEELLPTNYDHMHRRYLHHIVHCWRMAPTKRILMRKDGWSSAYKRMHLNATAAVQSLTKIEKEKEEFLLLPFDWLLVENQARQSGEKLQSQ